MMAARVVLVSMIAILMPSVFTLQRTNPPASLSFL
jgi:hypothetical protein